MFWYFDLPFYDGNHKALLLSERVTSIRGEKNLAAN